MSATAKEINWSGIPQPVQQELRMRVERSARLNGQNAKSYSGPVTGAAESPSSLSNTSESIQFDNTRITTLCAQYGLDEAAVRDSFASPQQRIL